MIGPFEIIVLTTRVARTATKTEQKAKQKWHFFLLTSRTECLTKNFNDSEQLMPVASASYSSSSLGYVGVSGGMAPNGYSYLLSEVFIDNSGVVFESLFNFYGVCRVSSYGCSPAD